MLKRAFSMFDSTKSGKIEKEKVRTILNTLGHTFDDHELDVMLKAEDDDGEYLQSFKDKFYYILLEAKIFFSLYSNKRSQFFFFFEFNHFFISIESILNIFVDRQFFVQK